MWCIVTAKLLIPDGAFAQLISIETPLPSQVYLAANTPLVTPALSALKMPSSAKIMSSFLQLNVLTIKAMTIKLTLQKIVELGFGG